MKGKERKRQVKRLRAIQKKWIGPLGLKWWNRVEFVYLDKRKPFQSKAKATETQRPVESVMVSYIDWARQWAEIEVNLPLVATLNDDELEHTTLHELCHVMVSAMKEGNDDLEELVVTRLAMAFKWVEELL